VYSGQTIERSYVRRPVLLAILIISVLAIALPVVAGGGGGCHGEFSDTSTTSVEVVESCFRSDVARIEVGDTVTWTNSDSYGHSIFSRQFAGTSNLDWGQSYSYTFSTAGVFPYLCTLHPGMMGVIMVGDAVAPPEGLALGALVIGDLEQTPEGLSWIIAAALLAGGLGLGVLVRQVRARTDASIAKGV